MSIADNTLGPEIRLNMLWFSQKKIMPFRTTKFLTPEHYFQENEIVAQ
jgi:hypothetical protein